MTIARACKDLMLDEPFYGLFLLNLNKAFSDKVPTAGVYIEGINQRLDINEDFWNSLNDKEQIAILKHELLHICFFHLTMRKDFSNFQLFNIAADLEINQYIANLPEGCLLLDMFGFENDPCMGTKWYYDKLQKQVESGEAGEVLKELLGENDGSGKPYGDKGVFSDKSGDFHGSWKEFDNLSDAEKKLVENQIDYHLKEAANQAQKNRGLIPGELKSKIDDLFKIKEQIFNWKAYFRRLIGSSFNTYTKKTLRKESKRFKDNAGIKVKQKHTVLVAVDTSGSVHDSEILEFFSEITHIYKSGVKVEVIEFDAKVNDHYVYNGKFKGGVSGRGGTDFEVALDFYNEHKGQYSTFIYFTDGYAPIDYRFPRNTVWVITANGYEQKYPGYTIKIPKKEIDV